MVIRKDSLYAGVAALAALSLSGVAQAQTSRGAEAVVTRAVDESDLVTVVGNTRPEVAHAKDLGRLPDSTPFPQLVIQLKRSPAQEARLQKFLSDVHDPASAEFHHWLTAAEFSDRFGLAAHDVDAVEMYLRSHGFTIDGTTANLSITATGTVGQIREAFHTEIHQIEVDGVRHVANMSDPRIPAALEPVLLGPTALHDFKPHPMLMPKRQPAYATSGGYQALVPLDLQTIYNFTPIYTAGTSGTGVVVAPIEDTNVYSTNDFTTFRRVFSLSSAYPAGNITQVHPTGAASCSNPGVVPGNAGEASLDVEWASSAAPSASIVLISCSDTSQFGGYIAMSNILNSSTAPYNTYKIFSVSYGESEEDNGASENSYINNLYALAAGEGASVFTSSGDEGAASSDANQSDAQHGITVSGFATSPNGVAVGGTDFADAYYNDTSKYWSSTNGKNYHSAKSYVPEVPWNDSCASQVLATLAGYSVTYGSTGFCNSSTASSDGDITTASGSGGPSGCATGTPNISGVKTGSCKGYAKPSWQIGLAGIGSDSVRDIPDISLFAANGALGHYYVYCYSNPNDGADGAAPCTGAPENWSGAGGTSFSAPILAGLQALIDQKDGAQGNPNPVLYGLADTEYNNATTKAACGSDKSGGPASTCIFYDVTLGDMDVVCKGTYNCYTPSGTYGVLSVQTTSYHPAYVAVPGYDYATGIGTVNAYNLWNSTAWSGAVVPKK